VGNTSKLNPADRLGEKSTLFACWTPCKWQNASVKRISHSKLGGGRREQN